MNEMCDAGHEVGRPCERPAAVKVGRVRLCQEHLEVLNAGLEADAASRSLYYARRFMGEATDAGPGLQERLDAVLSEVEAEHHTATQALEHFLERAGDRVEEATNEDGD